MGLFLKQYYRGDAVAVNDIGAINFLGEVDCLDVLGMSNIKMAEKFFHRTYSRQQMYDAAKDRNVKVAILFEHWFAWYGGPPSQWIKVAQWTIKNNIVCGGDSVSFYAVEQSEAHRLVGHLRAFSTSLPKNVGVVETVHWSSP